MKMGENLRITLAAARVNAGLTQEDIAREMQISKQTVVNWEKGRVKPKVGQFELYCRICGVSPDFIFMP